MELFLLSFVFIGLAAVGMALGVLLRGAELKGTCATLGGGVHPFVACEICRARSGRNADAPRRCARREMARRIADLTAARAGRL